MKHLNENREIFVDAIESVKKVFPKIKIINIHYDVDKEGQYITRMELRHGRKSFTATKTGPSFRQSLAHTKQAIFKQLEKFSGKHKRIFSRHLPITQ